VNPDFPIRYGKTADYQDLTAHAAESSKFGIPAEELELALQGIQLPISGLHLHVGTQMDRLESFVDAMEHLHRWADQLRKRGHPVQCLDLGGGLGIPFGAEDHFPSVKEFVEKLLPLRRPEFHYAVEPGHALVGKALALLTRLEKIKPSRGRRWGVVNVGTDQLAKITLLRWHHRVFSEKRELPWSGPDALAGPLCFAGDTLLPQTDLSDLKVGDPLLIADTGAYCSALANRFNGRLAPGTVLRRRDGTYVLVQEEEKGALDPSIVGYRWGSQMDPTEGKAATAQKDPIALAQEFYQLGSSYLWHLAAADQYKITEVHAIAPGTYDIRILTRSAVSFVSAPFALRMVGDAAIMAALHWAGETLKTAPVWGKTVLLHCNETITAGGTIPCLLTLSPIQEVLGKTSRRVWVRYELAGGKFSGQLELILS
jgi:diaminopimelate decarboxylase